MKTLGIVLVVVALVLGSLGFLLDSAAPVDLFKIGDGNSLLLGVGTGPSLSTRVTAVMETRHECDGHRPFDSGSLAEHW